MKTFKEDGLNITVEHNITTTDYLDVCFDLRSGTHRPYRKKNDQPTYIHVKSNHPPTIIKQIPEMISKRLSALSSTEDIFMQEVGIYNEALKNYYSPQPRHF